MTAALIVKCLVVLTPTCTTIMGSYRFFNSSLLPEVAEPQKFERAIAMNMMIARLVLNLILDLTLFLPIPKKNRLAIMISETLNREKAMIPHPMCHHQGRKAVTSYL